MYQAARDPNQYQPGVQQSQPQNQPQYGTPQQSYHAPSQHSSGTHSQHDVNYDHVPPPAPYANPNYLPLPAQIPAVAYSRPNTSGGSISTTESGHGLNSGHTYGATTMQAITQGHNWSGGMLSAQPLSGPAPWAPSPMATNINQVGTPMSMGPIPSSPSMSSQGYYEPQSVSGANTLPLPSVHQSIGPLPPITHQTMQPPVQIHYPSPISNQDSGVMSAPPLHQQSYTGALPTMQQGMYYANNSYLHNSSPSQHRQSSTTSFPGPVPPPPPYSHGPPKSLPNTAFSAEFSNEPQTYVELSAEPVIRLNDGYSSATAPLHSSEFSGSTKMHSRTGSVATDAGEATLPPPINYSSHPNNASTQAYTNVPDPIGPASPQPLHTASAETSLQKLEQPKPVHPEQTAKATAQQIASITPLSPQPQSAQLPTAPSLNSLTSMLSTPSLTNTAPPMSVPVGSVPTHYNPAHNSLMYNHSTAPNPQRMPYQQHQYPYLPPPPASMPPPQRDHYGNVLPSIQHILPPVYDGNQHQYTPGSYH